MILEQLNELGIKEKDYFNLHYKINFNEYYPVQKMGNVVNEIDAENFLKYCLYVLYSNGSFNDKIASDILKQMASEVAIKLQKKTEKNPFYSNDANVCISLYQILKAIDSFQEKILGFMKNKNGVISVDSLFLPEISTYDILFDSRKGSYNSYEDADTEEDDDNEY